MLIVYAGPQDYFLPGYPTANTPFEFNGTAEEFEHLKSQGYIEVQDAQPVTIVEPQIIAQPEAAPVAEGDPNTII